MIKNIVKNKKRPLASGKLSYKAGCLLAPLLTITALIFTLSLPLNFFVIAVTYYCLTIFYTFFIK